MWLFTKYGFYSAVCARQGDGQNGQPVDPRRIMVRARVRAHLEALQQRLPNLVGGCDIREDIGSDYAYRLFIDKESWSQALVELNAELDYDNFKSEVARFQGSTGRRYEHALHDVWDVMYRLQK